MVRKNRVVFILWKVTGFARAFYYSLLVQSKFQKENMLHFYHTAACKKSAENTTTTSKEKHTFVSSIVSQFASLNQALPEWISVARIQC